MKKILFLCAIASFITLSTFGQIMEPVKWSYSVKKNSPFSAILYVKASIDKGWHLYSQMVKEGGPTATKFTFLPTRNLVRVGRTIEPKPITKFEPVFNMEISYFETSAVFRQKFKLTGKSGTIKTKIEFMVCNDMMCLPPSEKEFSINVK